MATIYTAAGQSVYSDRLVFKNGQQQINLSNAVPGLYLLQLEDSRGRIFTLKFVIEQ